MGLQKPLETRNLQKIVNFPAFRPFNIGIGVIWKLFCDFTSSFLKHLKQRELNLKTAASGIQEVDMISKPFHRSSFITYLNFQQVKEILKNLKIIGSPR
jgi:hypothetical protein